MPFSEQVRKDALERAHHTCVVCRKPGFLEVHHIRPQQEGGPDTIENACPLCPSCHADFGDNKSKRAALTGMRDWWWSHCSRSDSSPFTKELSDRLETLQNSILSSNQVAFHELKDLITSGVAQHLQSILSSQSFQQLSIASGVTLPPKLVQPDSQGPPVNWNLGS